MYVTKSNIGAVEQSPNVGYVTHLLLIDVDDVLGLMDPVRFPNPQNIIPYGGIMVKPATPVTQLVFGDRSCTFQENSSENVDGIAYNVTIDTILPRGGIQLNTWLNIALQKRYVVLVRDANAQCYLIGEPGSGVRLTSAHALGTADATRLGITARAWHSCWRVAGIELALLFPDAEFDYSFDLSFTA